MKLIIYLSKYIKKLTDLTSISSSTYDDNYGCKNATYSSSNSSYNNIEKHIDNSELYYNNELKVFKITKNKNEKKMKNKRKDDSASRNNSNNISVNTEIETSDIVECIDIFQSLAMSIMDDINNQLMINKKKCSIDINNEAIRIHHHYCSEIDVSHQVLHDRLLVYCYHYSNNYKLNIDFILIFISASKNL